MKLPITTTTTTTNAVKTRKKDHVVIFPFFAKGHTIPLLHLADAFSSRNISVTIITTPANVDFIRHHFTSSTTASAAASYVRLLVIPFPHHPDLPSGVESTDELPSLSLLPSFLAATTFLHDPFSRLLRHLRSQSPPLCLISDFFLGWTLPICNHLGLPRLVFHGMSTFSMSLAKALWNNVPTDNKPFQVAGASVNLYLTTAELPEILRNSADPLNPTTQFINLTGETDVMSWGAIVNSFEELEPPEYVQLLESFYMKANGGRPWLVGPLSLIVGEEEKNDSDCIRWLDRQVAGSVVYIAFGTQAEVSDEQLDEVSEGLIQAGRPFIWVVRSETWTPGEGVSELGRIERGWVPQKEVLRHAAVGGFVSHCGWNSVLEAVSAGVAVLAWPMMAEQSLNAKLMAEEVGIGVRLKMTKEKGVVGRMEVEEGVRELMEGEKGCRVRKRAVELAKKAGEAVAMGGSSFDTLEKLIEELRKVTNVAMEEEGDEQTQMEVTQVEGKWKEEGLPADLHLIARFNAI